jgi:hypothetical protein
METTVRQAMELLSKMDPDAILCTAHIDDDVYYYWREWKIYKK